jgi:hypothetical protein
MEVPSIVFLSFATSWPTSSPLLRSATALVL